MEIYGQLGTAAAAVAMAGVVVVGVVVVGVLAKKDAGDANGAISVYNHISYFLVEILYRA